MQLAKQTGWIVRDFEIDDGCSEIENRDGMGREIEVKLDLPTLQVVETDYLDEVGPLFIFTRAAARSAERR